jgi:hypothetical protein
MKSHRILVIAMVLACIAAWTAQNNVGFGAGFQEKARVGSSKGFGGLRAAAGVSGTFTTAVPIREQLSLSSLRELIDLSELIVVGRTLSNAPRLTKDGLSIFSYYSVAVENVIGGPSLGNAAITIVVPGGRVGFEDGSWAQVNTPGFFRPTNGTRYMFFLSVPGSDIRQEFKLAPNGPLFVPVEGPLGIYELKSDGSPVRTSGLVRSRLSHEVFRADLTAEQFEAHVADLLAHKRK